MTYRESTMSSREQSTISAFGRIEKNLSCGKVCSDRSGQHMVLAQSRDPSRSIALNHQLFVIHL